MPKRVKLGHHYYYLVSPEELSNGNFRGKNVAISGVIEDKPVVEFFSNDTPSWRTTFKVNGLTVEFPGSPCIGEGDEVKVYGRFVGEAIIACAVETERAVFTTEE
jgi:hypothetical protein